MKERLFYELKMFLATALKQLGFPLWVLRSLLGLSPLQVHVISERAKMTTKFWYSVLNYYQWRCAKCGIRNFHNENAYIQKMEVDHIQPVSRWGYTTWNNLQVLCKPCNREKMTKTIDYRH